MHDSFDSPDGHTQYCQACEDEKKPHTCGACYDRNHVGLYRLADEHESITGVQEWMGQDVALLAMRMATMVSQRNAALDLLREAKDAPSITDSGDSYRITTAWAVRVYDLLEATK